MAGILDVGIGYKNQSLSSFLSQAQDAKRVDAANRELQAQSQASNMKTGQSVTQSATMVAMLASKFI